jgi:hypothetical protein
VKFLRELFRRKPKPVRPLTPTDYGPKLQAATIWLGENYLLAVPQQRRTKQKDQLEC